MVLHLVRIGGITLLLVLCMIYLSIPKIPSWGRRSHFLMMRRRSRLRIDDSISGRRRVALQRCTWISACADSPSIDLINITAELTGSLTLCGSSITMMQPADLRDCYDSTLSKLGGGG